MSLFNRIFKQRLQIGLLAMLLATFVGGIVANTRAQEQEPTVCHVFGRVRICGDEFTDSGGAAAIHGKIITLGREDQPQTVRVSPPSLEQDESVRAQVVIVDPGSNAAVATVIGDLSLLGDFMGRPLVRTRGSQSPRTGVMEIELEGGRVINPREKVASHDFRNEGLSFDFLTSFATPKVFSQGSPNKLSDIETTFDLSTGRFIATVPISDQRLLFGRDDVFPKSAVLKVGVSLDNKADGEITIEAFKAEFFGMIGEFKGIKIIRSPLGLGSSTLDASIVQVEKPVDLEIESVSFHRADNPGVPNLDPADPNLIFSLKGLQFKNGKFSMRGGAVGIPDWEVGRAFKLTNQQISLQTNKTRTQTTMVVSSTLSFPPGSVLTEGRSFPMAITIGSRQLPDGKVTTGITGTLLNAARPALDLGPLTISTPARTQLIFDPVQNFFGISADQVSVKWDNNLGDGNVKPSVTMFIRSGKDVRDSCSSSVPTCKRRFEFSLSRFEFSLAGFGIGVGNARGTGDGGFAVDSATLKAPIGVKSFGGSIQGLLVSGEGNVTLTGGSVELPPLQIGGFSLAGVKGSFLKTVSGYEFKGVGTVPLPGLEPNSGKKISGEVIVRARPDGSFTGFGVSITFNTGSPGIPIASTGMELTSLRGGFDVNSGTVKITVGMRASSLLRFGPLPAVTADGTASLQFQPFQLTANAKLSVLVIQVAEASIGIGHQQGFNGGPGFNVSFDINFVLARGETELRIGPTTLSNGQRKTIIAASAAYTIGIKRSAIFPLMPPRDINVARLDFKGGTFTVKGKDETLGLLGRVKIPMPLFIPDVKVSVFVNLEDRKVDVTDTDDYKLIDGTTLRARASQGLAGYSTRTLSLDEARTLNLDDTDGATCAGAKQIQQETLPVLLDHPGMALFGISYPAGNKPSLRLRLPDGSILTEQSVDPATVHSCATPKASPNPTSWPSCLPMPSQAATSSSLTTRRRNTTPFPT